MAYYVKAEGILWELSELAYSVLLSKVQMGQLPKLERLGKQIGTVIDVTELTSSEAFRLQMELYENRSREVNSSQGANGSNTPSV